MASPSNGLPPRAVNSGSSLDVTKRNDLHKHARVFIGPMPEKFLSETEALVRQKRRRWFSRSKSSDTDDVNGFIRDHAFRTFLHRDEDSSVDWDEEEERGRVEEILDRWKESDWGKVWRRRATEPATNHRWVGSSFEIGNFLGVNLLQDERPASPAPTGSTQSKAPKSRQFTAASSTKVETFVTAPSQIRSSLSSSQAATPLASPGHLQPTIPEGDELPRPLSTSSSTTPLLTPEVTARQDASSRAHTEAPRRPALKSASRVNAISDGQLGNVRTPEGSYFANKKGKTVHYCEEVDEDPASPREVLARTGSSIDTTSAGATKAPSSFTDAEWGDEVMRDRMIVRVSYSEEESLGPNFDEYQNRSGRYDYEDMGEFLVAWRKDRLELYEDYHLPLKEWATGHKHFSFLVPFNSPRTKLYLYSFVDMSFCLTCPPTPVRSDSKRRKLFHRAKRGINIFIFKMKSRSRATDWIWNLWRRLGGQLPTHLDISSPALDTRVRIAIPGFEESDPEGRGYVMFSRENIIALCRKTLKSVKDWEYLVEKPLSEGSAHLELAWRMDTKLDWVWRHTDDDEERRPWEVICGLALIQGGKPAHLEIRLARHYPTHLHLRDGTHLTEPPAIEGYLDRVRANTPGKQAVYLTTHNGYLFALSANSPHPPSPPGLPLADNKTTLRDFEIRRGMHQIMEAQGMTDMRNILVIRRAFQPAVRHTEEHFDAHVFAVDERGLQEEVERMDSDADDEGGDEELGKSDDKPKLRMKRSFELVLKNGHIFRFEAHSRRIALEWIDRLRALVRYWKHRHRIDAREEMNVVQLGTGRARPTPRIFRDGHTMHTLPPDPEASLPDLSNIFNWCVLDKCRPILKGGKLYVRKGLRGRYKYVQLFLVSGHLIQYHITPKASMYHRRTKRTISLVDAYVCSGYFAAKVLPESQYNPDAPPIPRKYPDGLETEDLEEDTIFMVWYHPYPVGSVDEERGQSKAGASKKIPKLSKKRKMEVFRARSRMERDIWCWALNCEIEKTLRTNRDRENKLRDEGELVPTT
ncbi:hypothetical protein GLOTRDRAFT_43400 [Gloeophyllum trabeum ATCC 11539]|uniref:PH domain-containing protein n=1 Tax=Gloeophyllum trabeum (strain ATCC 11539 / FP-39264 / Madison 617) TaxID=670483 RepID=S7Q647_GLOTA|nr:uncharacterized protein GLOTRDRAFT_43400 [Gloeophyllum trabeum ATCC 11539]EPQ54943.1 hypothetical protein GLOTRDRAFT_43400 [Gloeophyllum trabeum ATCC 11539]